MLVGTGSGFSAFSYPSQGSSSLLSCVPAPPRLLSAGMGWWGPLPTALRWLWAGPEHGYRWAHSPSFSSSSIQAGSQAPWCCPALRRRRLSKLGALPMFSYVSESPETWSCVPSRGEEERACLGVKKDARGAPKTKMRPWAGWWGRWGPECLGEVTTSCKVQL